MYGRHDKLGNITETNENIQAFLKVQAERDPVSPGYFNSRFLTWHYFYFLMFRTFPEILHSSNFCLFEVPLTKNRFFVIFREPKHFLIFQCKIVPLQCPTVLTLFTVWFYLLPFSSYKRFSFYPFIFIILEMKKILIKFM